jgi:hypothetical protein
MLYGNKIGIVKRICLIFSSLMLAVFVSCVKQDSVTAIIRVAHGAPPQVESADGYYLDTETATFRSRDFALHIDEKFNLSKLWGLSEDQVVAKLRNAITVNAGSEPGLFVIKVNGLEHGLAVSILNELCDYYTKMQLTESVNGGQQQKINVSIVRGAE